MITVFNRTIQLMTKEIHSGRQRFSLHEDPDHGSRVSIRRQGAPLDKWIDLLTRGVRGLVVWLSRRGRFQIKPIKPDLTLNEQPEITAFPLLKYINGKKIQFKKLILFFYDFTVKFGTLFCHFGSKVMICTILNCC